MSWRNVLLTKCDVRPGLAAVSQVTLTASLQSTVFPGSLALLEALSCNQSVISVPWSTLEIRKCVCVYWKV